MDLSKFRYSQRLPCRRRYLVDDLSRRSPWNEQPNRRLRRHLRHPGFAHGREIRGVLEPLWRCDRENPQLAGPMKCKQLAVDRRNRHWNLSANQVGNCGASSAIRHMDDIRGTDKQFEPLAGQMVQAADTGCSIRQFARIALGIVRELIVRTGSIGLTANACAGCPSMETASKLPIGSYDA